LSQNQICKPTVHQSLFPLNIRNVNQLFPGFSEGDFALIHGSSSVQSLTTLLCVRAQLAKQLGGLGSNVIFIDGGNTFRLYQITRLAQAHQLNPKQALDKIYISRAFTAYQLTALIMQKLRDAVKKFDAKLIIVSDITEFFLDKDLSDGEAQSVFSQITTYLSKFAYENQVIVIATDIPHGDQRRNSALHTLACQRAGVILSLNRNKVVRTIGLEKHPYLKLGSVELPSEDIKLTDFIGDRN
jgi:predicted ATP-dependent serine protease